MIDLLTIQVHDWSLTTLGFSYSSGKCLFILFVYLFSRFYIVRLYIYAPAAHMMLKTEAKAPYHQQKVKSNPL